MTFSGNVDNGPRNRGLHFGDVLDYPSGSRYFLKDSCWGAPMNELLGGGLRSLSVFLVYTFIDTEFIFQTILKRHNWKFDLFPSSWWMYL